MPRVTRAAAGAEGQQTSKAKIVLGWGEDNVGEYRRWRRRMKYYAAGIAITGRQGTSDTQWEAFHQYGMSADNSLPASGRRLLRTAKGDKDGDKARERYHHLMLDSLKKDRETENKEGLLAAARRRQQAANDSEEETSMRVTSDRKTIRVIMVDSDNAGDLVTATGEYR